MSQINIVMFGAKGTGKSFLGNSILDMDEILGFPTTNPLCCVNKKKEVDNKALSIVEVPAFFRHSNDIKMENWKAVIVAQSLLQYTTNIFVIILDFQDPDKSERIVQAFKNLHGPRAMVNSFVVFRNVPDVGNIQRQRKCDFHFLFSYLAEDYPFYLWDTHSSQADNIQNVLDKINEVALCRPYSLSMFREAQLQYLKQTNPPQSMDMLRKIKVETFYEHLKCPDIFVSKLYEDDSGPLLDRLIQLYT